MKLYWAPPAASLAILSLAYEIGLPVELVRVDLETSRAEDGRGLAEINPKGCLPVIERDDGSIVTETAVILDWLSARDPDLRLTGPAHGEVHLRIVEWMTYFATEQHKIATLLFWDDIGEPMKTAIRRRIVQRFELAERALAKADHLVGGMLSIADLYLLVMVRGVAHLCPDFDAARDVPAIDRAMKRVLQRPAVARALRDHS